MTYFFKYKTSSFVLQLNLTSARKAVKVIVNLAPINPIPAGGGVNFTPPPVVFFT